MAQQNTTPKWLDDPNNSGVVLSSVDIKVSSLSLQSEVDGDLNLDPSSATRVDCFILESIKD